MAVKLRNLNRDFFSDIDFYKKVRANLEKEVIKGIKLRVNVFEYQVRRLVRRRLSMFDTIPFQYEETK
jgi:hypothetical protein